MKHIAIWAPQGSMILDVTLRTRTAGGSVYLNFLGFMKFSMKLMQCSSTSQVDVSFLGRSNHTQISKMKVDEEFHPYLTILIDKDEAQVKGSEIKLRNYLK
jgi:non-homologous end joining protein Ku